MWENKFFFYSLFFLSIRNKSFYFNYLLPEINFIAVSSSSLGNEDSSWWKHTVIGALGGLVWVVLCILIICLCKRRRAQKKANKQTGSDIVTGEQITPKWKLANLTTHGLFIYHWCIFCCVLLMLEYMCSVCNLRESNQSLNCNRVLKLLDLIK